MADVVAGGKGGSGAGRGQGKRSDVPPPGSVKCGICSKRVLVKDKALQCEICLVWYHCSCEQIDDQAYNLICDDTGKTDPLFHYFCSKQCNKPASKFLRSLIELESEVQKLSGRVAGVESRVVQVDSRMEEMASGKFTPAMIETVKEISLVHATGNASGQRSEVASLIRATTKEELAEMEDRGRRKTNVLIFGLGEDKEKAMDDRRKEDEKRVGQLLKAIELEQKTPIDLRRLGVYSGGDEKVRPLRLTFNSEASRNEVVAAFHRAKKAAGKAGEQGENGDLVLTRLGMRRDLTPKERVDEAALFEELRRRRQESQNSGDQHANWILRRGKIENVGRYPQGDAK